VSVINTAAVGHKRRSVSTLMLHVIIALLPGVVVYTLIIDSRLPLNLLIACFFAVLIEAALVAARKRPVLPRLQDMSVIVAAILLVLCIPQQLPLWQLLFGIFILCTLGKHVFGGLGHNPFNPAMVAYAVLIISFPLTMTQWSTERGLLDPPLAQSNNEASQAQHWNGISQATPLDRLDSLKRDYRQSSSDETLRLNTSVDTAIPATAQQFDTKANNELVLNSEWAWLSIAWLVGGLYLLAMRIISWHIPLTVITTLWLLYFMQGLISNTPTLSAHAALLSGAIMLGAFFIATDPVSAATSKPGKLIYGTGIGMLCFFIREFSAYPEGFAFAVLLMNIAVPLIDYMFIRNPMALHSQRRDRSPPQ